MMVHSAPETMPCGQGGTGGSPVPAATCWPKALLLELTLGTSDIYHLPSPWEDKPGSLSTGVVEAAAISLVPCWLAISRGQEGKETFEHPCPLYQTL